MTSHPSPEEIRSLLIQAVPDEEARLAFYRQVGRKCVQSTANLMEDLVAEGFSDVCGAETGREVGKALRGIPWPPFLPDGW